MGPTGELSDYIARTSLDDIPQDVTARAKEALANYIAEGLVGSQNQLSIRLIDYIDTLMPGDEATIIGHGRSSTVGAAFANGVLPMSIGAGDTFESVIIHPTMAVAPAAFTVTESEGFTGADLLRAYVLGVDADFRLGHATYPSHYQYWHGSGSIGIFGVVSAVSSLYGLTGEEVRQAFGIAASFSAGLKRNLPTNTDMAPVHIGHAIEMGIRAVTLARSGISADGAIFEGENGYCAAMTSDGDYSLSALSGGLHRDHGVMDLMLKPYPSGFVTHSAMEALRKIVDREDLSPAAIEAVDVKIDSSVSNLLLDRPTTAREAQLSMEFCLAVIMRERAASHEHFTEKYLAEGETQALMEIVTCHSTEGLLAETQYNSSYRLGSRVTVKTASGNEYEQVESHPPGSPKNPISTDQLDDKFFRYSNTVIEAQQARDLREELRALETVEDVGSMIDLCSKRSRS